jgi:hypothetical protein
MSFSNEFDRVTSIGRYKAQSVIEALGIPDDDFIARKSVEFVYKQMLVEFRPSCQNSLQASVMTSQETFKKISARYDLGRLYEDYFFPLRHSLLG